MRDNRERLYEASYPCIFAVAIMICALGKGVYAEEEIKVKKPEQIIDQTEEWNGNPALSDTVKNAPLRMHENVQGRCQLALTAFGAKKCILL